MRNPIHAPKHKVYEVIEYIENTLNIPACLSKDSRYDSEEKQVSANIGIQCPYWHYPIKGVNVKHSHDWENHEWELHKIVDRIHLKFGGESIVYKDENDATIARLNIWWKKDTRLLAKNYKHGNNDLIHHEDFEDNSDYEDDNL